MMKYKKNTKKINSVLKWSPLKLILECKLERGVALDSENRTYHNTVLLGTLNNPVSTFVI